MKDASVVRDERTLAVENASYRLGYLFLSFGLLIIVAYRGLVLNASSWDLLSLVILSGLVTTLYQGLHRILSRQWALIVISALVLAVFAAWGTTVFGVNFALVMMIPALALFAIAFRKVLR